MLFNFLSSLQFYNRNMRYISTKNVLSLDIRNLLYVIAFINLRERVFNYTSEMKCIHFFKYAGNMNSGDTINEIEKNPWYKIYNNSCLELIYDV